MVFQELLGERYLRTYNLAFFGGTGSFCTEQPHWQQMEAGLKRIWSLLRSCGCQESQGWRKGSYHHLLRPEDFFPETLRLSL